MVDAYSFYIFILTSVLIQTMKVNRHSGSVQGACLAGMCFFGEYRVFAYKSAMWPSGLNQFAAKIWVSVS